MSFNPTQLITKTYDTQDITNTLFCTNGVMFNGKFRMVQLTNYSNIVYGGPTGEWYQYNWYINLKSFDFNVTDNEYSLTNPTDNWTYNDRLQLEGSKYSVHNMDFIGDSNSIQIVRISDKQLCVYVFVGDLSPTKVHMFTLSALGTNNVSYVQNYKVLTLPNGDTANCISANLTTNNQIKLFYTLIGQNPKVGELLLNVDGDVIENLSSEFYQEGADPSTVEWTGIYTPSNTNMFSTPYDGRCVILKNAAGGLFTSLNRNPTVYPLLYTGGNYSSLSVCVLIGGAKAMGGDADYSFFFSPMRTGGDIFYGEGNLNPSSGTTIITKSLPNNDANSNYIWSSFANVIYGGLSHNPNINPLDSLIAFGVAGNSLFDSGGITRVEGGKEKIYLVVKKIFNF